MNAKKIMPSVCAIVVTFNPDLNMFSKLISSINSQVNGIIVVDNGSADEKVNGLKATMKEDFTTFISLSENIGLASAQNIGLKKGLTEEYTHFLLLDQDSVPNDDMVYVLLKYYYKLKEIGVNVGCLGPRFIDSRNNYNYLINNYEADYNNVDFLIASGSLIPRAVIEKVGLMLDDLFIYHVDREWCYRAINKGFKLYWVKDAIMKHTVGERTIKIWIGKWRNISVHNPISHYYVMRNSIMLQKLDYVPMKWKIKNVARMYFMLLFYSLFTPPRVQHLLHILRGLYDGIRGRFGKITNY